MADSAHVISTDLTLEVPVHARAVCCQRACQYCGEMDKTIPAGSDFTANGGPREYTRFTPVRIGNGVITR